MGHSRSDVLDIRFTGSRARSDSSDGAVSAGGAGAAAADEPRFRLSVRKVSWRSALSVELPVLTFLVAVILVSIISTPELKVGAFGRSIPLISLSWFHYLTDFPCPFCGMTRSFVAMGGLDFKQALIFNPLGPALFFLWGGVTATMAAAFISRRRIRFSIDSAMQKRINLSVFGLLAATWVIKLYVWSQVGLL